MQNIDKKALQEILRFQKSEITEFHIYRYLSKKVKDSHNKDILNKIANEEKSHYEMWKKITDTDVSPNKFKIIFYVALSWIFGLTFGLKLMEYGEKQASHKYDQVRQYMDNIDEIIKDELKHEHELLDMIKEGKLSYVGSIVLGLNDALVELTGALAGLTFAFQSGQLVAIAGFITGVAAAFSMAASEYLSTKAEDGHDRDPILAAIYTGIAYFVTVILLIAPYLILSSPFQALVITLIIGVLIILFFTFYSSVALNKKFWKPFFEMVSLSLGVAALTFLLGYLVRIYFGVEI